MNMLNFKNKEDLTNDITNKTCNSIFVNGLVIMNPDKQCTWSKVPLKQIVLRLGTSYEILHNLISPKS